MSEENEVKALPEGSSSEKQRSKKPGDKKDNVFAMLSKGLMECVAEYKKVTWPKRDVLIKETVTVIFTSVIIGAVIAGLDVAFAYIYQYAVK
jgi:preprotein translocase subunit SecE